jgi:uncharacterized membrane protein YgdD (TMEM256/DUF423 family)
MAANLAKHGRPVYKWPMKKWLFIAAVNGALAVIAGDLAAHAGSLGIGAQADIRLGASYQLSHALAIGLAAFSARDRAAPCAGISAVFFLAGIVLFSGGLYVLALTGAHGLAFMIPFGGASFIAGWIALAIAALKLEAR